MNNPVAKQVTSFDPDGCLYFIKILAALSLDYILILLLHELN